jgi:hypothetical protein
MIRPIVIGTTAFLYIHCFNFLMKEYKKSSYTMNFKDIFNVYNSLLYNKNV